MARIQYEDWRPGAAALALIDQANAICADYRRQGFDLSLRQLYYQFVQMNVIPNTERSYKNLGGVISRARLAGLLDWDYIVDRGRSKQGGASTMTSDRVVELYARANHVSRWATQDYYVEVWVEKDALSGVIERACSPLEVPYLACKGYMSQSEQHAAGRRLLGKINSGKRCIVVHLGDHDPSGIDMTRDIGDRLTKFVDVGWSGGNMYGFSEADLRVAHEDTEVEFSEQHGGYGHPLEIRRIALSMAQIRRYDPPPNPAKFTDSRATDYIEKFGTSSWELDALNPSILVDLITNEINPLIDEERWTEAEDQEREDRRALTSLAQHWTDVREWMTSTGRLVDADEVD